MNSPEGNRPPQEGSQGELSIEVKKELSREELISRANKVLLLFAERAIPSLREEVREGKGRQVVASTQEGRPGEELIGIDQPAENILKAAIREAQLPAILISEGTPEPTEFGNGATEKFYVYSDPFDNSSPYKRGLDIPPYTVCSIWDKDGQPIGAVVGDIQNRKAYVSMGGETFMWDLEQKPLARQSSIERTNKLISDEIVLLERKRQSINGTPEQLQQLSEVDRQLFDLRERVQKEQEGLFERQKQEPERKKITRSERTTLRDRNSTLASFVGENEYSLEFFKYFGQLVKDMDRKGFLYTGGGAYIYGLLASGAIDAYVMFNEPVSEIIPGVPLALATGCTVVSVNEDGTYREFKFDPNALRENYKLYSEGVVPLFIATATPEIRDQIIKYYLEEKTRSKAEETKQEDLATELTELRKFRDSRPAEEIELFRALQKQNPSTS